MAELNNPGGGTVLESRKEATNAAEPKLMMLEMLACLQSPACLLNCSGLIQCINADWKELTGNCVGENLASLIDPRDRGYVESHWNGVTTAIRRVELQCRLLGEQKQPHWYVISLQRCQWPSENVSWLCLATDIHSIKLREQELQALTRIQNELFIALATCTRR